MFLGGIRGKNSRKETRNEEQTKKSTPPPQFEQQNALCKLYEFVATSQSSSTSTSKAKRAENNKESTSRDGSRDRNVFLPASWIGVRRSGGSSAIKEKDSSSVQLVLV